MDLEKKEQKEIFKEALKEWLDEKASQFGKFTLKYLAMSIFGFVIYYLATHGWLK